MSEEQGGETLMIDVLPHQPTSPPPPLPPPPQEQPIEEQRELPKQEEKEEQQQQEKKEEGEMKEGNEGEQEQLEIEHDKVGKFEQHPENGIEKVKEFGALKQDEEDVVHTPITEPSHHSSSPPQQQPKEVEEEKENDEGPPPGWDAPPPPPLTQPERGQMVCGSCRRLLSYPQGSKHVQCSCCQTVNYVLEEHHIGQVKCGNCQLLLMYPYGAHSVRCCSCNSVIYIGDHNRRPPLSVQQSQACRPFGVSH